MIAFDAIRYSRRAFAIEQEALDEAASLQRSIDFGNAMFTLISMILAYRRQSTQHVPSVTVSGGDAANDHGLDRSDQRAA